MKQLFILSLLLALLLLSACSRNELNSVEEWKETESPENLVNVVFSGSQAASVTTRTALPENTPVTVYVFRRASAATQDLTADPYKVVTGTASYTGTGTGTAVADLSTLTFTSGNQTNGKLQVTKGYTYDFVMVTSQSTGTSLTNGVLSGLPMGIDLLAGRAENVAVATNATSVTVMCTAGGADSYGNMPRLAARLALNISNANIFITGLGLTSATVKVKSLTLKNINTTASLDFAGSPLALSNNTTAGNYTFTTTDNNSNTISTTTSSFGYDPGIYVLSSTAASTVNYDLVLTVNGTDYTFSNTASLPAMTGGNVYTLDSSMDMNMYPIVYDTNGGTGAPGVQYKLWGTNITIPATTPTRTGYNFLGWATSITATTAYIAPGTTGVTDANLDKGSSYTSGSVTLSAIWGPVAHKGWAGSNIYWDGTKLTFDDVNVSTHEQYQGVYFQGGSLWGISPMGAWSGSTILYAPNGTSGAASSYGYSLWSSWPKVTDNIAANRDRAYAYEITDGTKGVGDICKYMTDKGWAPAGKKWRMPTSNEFETVSSYTTMGTFVPQVSTNAAGQFPISSGRFKNDNSSGIQTSPFFPASGLRYDNNGSLFGVVEYGYYKSSSIGGTGSYVLDFGLNFVNSGNSMLSVNYPLSLGHSVRCVVE